MSHIALLATGGTIAGLQTNGFSYEAACLCADELLSGLPDLPWPVRVKQIMSLDSRDLTPTLMLTLAREIDACLHNPEVRGIVITHGTDTLEESAFLLSRVLPLGKPVVFTAAMRPADSLSSDGPMNLYQALLLAGGEHTPPGVMAVLNDIIYCGASLRKVKASQLDAFQGRQVGQVKGGQAHFHALPYNQQPLFKLRELGALKEVPLLYVYAGMTPEILDKFLNYPGLALAAAGNGSLPQNLVPSLLAAQAKGMAIVVASRTGGGYVAASEHKFMNAGWLNPLQARILLQLSLSSNNPAPAELFANL